MTVSPAITITGQFGPIPVTSAAMAQDVKNGYHDRQARLWIEALWDSYGQRNAALVYASGADSTIMTLAQAKLCLDTVAAGVTACRAFQSQISDVIANTSLTEAQQIAAIDAIAWIAPTAPTS